MNGKILIPMVKSGRCANGAERGAGTVVHAVWVAPNVGCWGWDKALCGEVPGRLSAGWVRVEKVVTCERCAKKVRTA